MQVKKYLSTTKNTNKTEKEKKWERIFAYGESLSSKYKFTEDDVNKEIEKYRKSLIR